MKKLILTAIAVTCAVGVFAQGTIVFNNRVVGSVITHVYLGGTAQVVGNGTGDYSDTTLTPGSRDWTGYTALSGSGYMAQLLGATGAGQPESALGLGTPTTTFRTGAAAGFINSTTATMGTVAADAAVGTIELVAWDNSTGQYPTWAQARPAWLAGTIAGGVSGPFNLSAIGGVTTPAPYLFGLQSFNIYTVPEPAAFALLGMGGAAMLIFRRRK
jgi:hypothetical protein